MFSRNSRKVLDTSEFFRHSTAPQLAAFILPSRGRVVSSLRSHNQMCDKGRDSMKAGQRRLHHFGSDDRGTKRLSPGVLFANEA
jgi:hypothetical protein